MNQKNKVGIGTRVLNFLIDTILIFLLSFTLYKINNWYAFFYHTTYHNFWVCFAVILFGYYFIFESLTGGRTLGKFASYSKVVVCNTNNSPSVFRIIVRTLVRFTIIDCFLIPFLDKTLHEYLSGTELIEV